MFKVTVLNAENIPVLSKKVKKTAIYCFSTFFHRYFYGAFKNDEKTTDPTWNISFNVELYRCGTLNFKLYSSQFFSKSVFLGRVDINMKDFLSKPPGNEIFKTPYCTVKYKFPLASCSSPDAKLFISILYIPKDYPPIIFSKIKDPHIYVWTTFSPALQNSQDMLDFELFQVMPSQEKKSKDCLYFNFGKEHPWDSIGFRSSSNMYYTQSGFSQLLTLVPTYISRKYNFLILNVPNGYSGVITVNFIAENRFKVRQVKGNIFTIPTDEIGLFKTVDIQVTANKKYCVPFYICFKRMYYNKLTSDTFDIISTDIVENDNESDLVERSNPYMPFYENILRATKSRISELSDANFMKAFALPKIGRISLSHLFQSFNISLDNKIRIYINGSRQPGPDSNVSVYWKHNFIVYDKKKREKCPGVSDQFSTIQDKPIFKDNLVMGNEWCAYADLNLDKLGIDRVAVFAVSCTCDMRYTNPFGLLLISHVDDQKDTVLIRNEIRPKYICVHMMTLFRLEFIEDSWIIIPMIRSFTNREQMNQTVDSMFSNNWEMPPIEIDETGDLDSLSPFTRYDNY